MISSAVRITLRSLLRSDLVAELNQTEDRLNDGGVELFQQLLWQVELPQLAKDVQPLLGLFHHGLDVSVPLQVLRNCGEWLHCSHSAVHDGEWGRAGGGGGGGVSPEVHDHLHCFERVQLQVVKTAPESQLLNLLSVSRPEYIAHALDEIFLPFL